MSLLLALTAQAAVVKATWTASSSEAPTEDASYDVSNLGDGKQSHAWFEGVEGSGLGEWVQADLGGSHVVTGFTVWAGWWYTKSQWGHYNRPKVIVVELADGSSQEFTLADTFAPQPLSLAAPKATTSLKFKVKSVFVSDAYNDTAISEIQIHDTEREAGGRVNRYAASSTYPADSDGTYELRNTTDGIADSLWCEGNKTGDGTAEWVEYGFAAPASVSRMVIRNGNASSFGLYMKSNRATAVTLVFGDGSTAPVALKDTPGEQTLVFPARTTGQVRIRFDTVKKGTEFNDMCVAEVSFR
jgi:hypothetical protein